MYMVTTTKTDVSSVILDLETLTAKYDKVLVQYSQAQTDYLNYLKQPPSSDLVKIDGNTYYTSVTLSNTTTDDVDKCQALCETNSKCSGATFSTTDNVCSIYGEEGDYKPSLPTDVAIVPKKKQLLAKMKGLNDLLVSLNSQILETVSESEPLYNTQVDERDVKKKEIIDNSSKLKIETDKIKKIQQEEIDLEKKNEEAILTTQRYRYLYILLFLCALFVLYITFKYLFGSGTSVQNTSYVNQTGATYL
jgi:hypothetical protein